MKLVVPVAYMMEKTKYMLFWRGNPEEREHSVFFKCSGMTEKSTYQAIGSRSSEM
jgi:hypothetical protein